MDDLLAFNASRAQEAGLRAQLDAVDERQAEVGCVLGAGVCLEALCGLGGWWVFGGQGCPSAAGLPGAGSPRSPAHSCVCPSLSPPLPSPSAQVGDKKAIEEEYFALEQRLVEKRRWVAGCWAGP